MHQRICSIEGCEKPARSSKADWCRMHYHRWYRHGSPHMTSVDSSITVSLGRRYKATTDRTHPLAMANGRVYVHRKVLYDAIGTGPHPCHWCETDVDWLPKGDPRELQPDHLNGDGADNRIDNLVPSCRACNTLRGSQLRAVALRESGWWSSHDTVAQLASGGRRPKVERRAS